MAPIRSFHESIAHTPHGNARLGARICLRASATRAGESSVAKRVLIIDGHPDHLAEHYVHALATAYRDGAQLGNHEVRSIIVSETPFPLLRTNADFTEGFPVETISRCQE